MGVVTADAVRRGDVFLVNLNPTRVALSFRRVNPFVGS
jgi:hypothetical protein